MEKVSTTLVLFCLLAGDLIPDLQNPGEAAGFQHFHGTNEQKPPGACLVTQS